MAPSYVHKWPIRVTRAKDMITKLIKLARMFKERQRKVRVMDMNGALRAARILKQESRLLPLKSRFQIVQLVDEFRRNLDIFRPVDDLVFNEEQSNLCQHQYQHTCIGQKSPSRSSKVNVDLKGLDVEEKKQMKKKKKGSSETKNASAQPRNMPFQALTRAWPYENGMQIEMEFLCSKRLTHSDVAAQQNRFQFYRGDFESRVLPKLTSPEEEEAKDRGLNVKVLDGNGRSYTLRLKCWESTKHCVFNGKDLRRFIGENGLEVGHLFELYACRLDDQMLIFGMREAD